MKSFAFALVAACLLLPSPAGATTFITFLQGGIIIDSLHGGGTLAISSPGTPFACDFTAQPGGIDHQDICIVSLIFGCQTPYTSLNIVLDSDPAVYSFAPTAPSTSQTAAVLYNPTYYITNPSGNTPAYVMPSAWKTELDDGILSGHLWVTGAPWPPQFANLGFSVGAVQSDDAPEPATAMLLAIGGLAILRRRRGRS